MLNGNVYRAGIFCAFARHKMSISVSMFLHARKVVVAWLFVGKLWCSRSVRPDGTNSDAKHRSKIDGGEEMARYLSAD